MKNLDNILKRVLMITSIITLVSISFKVWKYDVNEYLNLEETPLRDETNMVIGVQNVTFNKKSGDVFVWNKYNNGRGKDMEDSYFTLNIKEIVVSGMKGERNEKD